MDFPPQGPVIWPRMNFRDRPSRPLSSRVLRVEGSFVMRGRRMCTRRSPVGFNVLKFRVPLPLASRAVDLAARAVDFWCVKSFRSSYRGLYP